MALDSKHPQYELAFPEWIKLRDCYAGEGAVKMRGTAYLPPTPGQILDGMLPDQAGHQNYLAYKIRAVFPSFVTDAIKAQIGVMWHKPPVIELPSALEPLRELATADGESLTTLLRRINAAQLTTGRIGALLDLPEQASTDVRFFLATYEAERAINWDVDLVVLDESESERDANFEWQMVKKYRVLTLADGLYQQAQFRETNNYDATALRPPSVRGKALDRIPFVFINSGDVLTDVSAPPHLDLANLCLAIYRGEADYRQNLFMQSQDTFVTVGAVTDANDPAPVWRLGAGGAVNLPAGGDARFEGVTSDGLPEQRQALENDRRRAAAMGAQLLDTSSHQKESGEALGIRVAAQTATLNQIALTGAFGLQSLLRIAAEWVGANPEEVVITPNLDFSDAGMAASEFLQLVQAKELGLPLSNESLHALAVENEYTVKDFAAEMQLIETERAAAQARLSAQRAAMPPESMRQAA